ncbi:hypothetical protein SDC9_110822 [bioreactor metagenome]|uniref:Uncharacterized protein n=1 Tax=bioreactor metagenome TaxID=1076179 RepID=A0A645BF28_9ZZZZ
MQRERALLGGPPVGRLRVGERPFGEGDPGVHRVLDGVDPGQRPLDGIAGAVPRRGGRWRVVHGHSSSSASLPSSHSARCGGAGEVKVSRLCR